MKRILIAVVCIVFCIGAASVTSGYQNSLETGIHTGVYYGICFLDQAGESYGLKPLQSAGLGLYPYMQTPYVIGMRLALTVGYTLRSNYQNGYYYTSFFTCGIAPQLVLALNIRALTVTLFSGPGYDYLFSRYGNRGNMLFTAGIGVSPSHGFIREVNLGIHTDLDERFVRFDTVRAGVYFDFLGR